MDAQTINQTADLLTICEAQTELKPAGRYYVGPCPFCGGRDRFTLKQTREGWRWHCRNCGDGKYHTAIDFVMRRDDCDFKAALKALGGDATLARTTTPKRRAEPEPLKMPADDWQRAAWAIVDTAVDALHGPQGEPGRAAWARRGLSAGTLATWNLGYDPVCYDPKTKQRCPALVIPWFDVANGIDTITAIKYRFIDPDPAGLRYTSKAGSLFFIYGLNAAASGGDLLIIEGEINALSIWETWPQGLTVLSIGSESGGRPDLLGALARRYLRAWLWSDDPTKTTNQQRALGLGADRLIKSPVINGAKIDANDMLQRGLLADFLTARLGVVCKGR